ncbi:MAG: hypothetical protein IJX98_02905 [Clostridia bacterium]|nr:hypothetical protein [Clostridia bacterium]
MAEFRKWMDELPLWLKIVFALPGIDGIMYGIYRIAKGDTPNLVLGIIWLVAGTMITWVLDIAFLLWKGKVLEIE